MAISVASQQHTPKASFTLAGHPRGPIHSSAWHVMKTLYFKDKIVVWGAAWERGMQRVETSTGSEFTLTIWKAPFLKLGPECKHGLGKVSAGPFSPLPSLSLVKIMFICQAGCVKHDDTRSVYCEILIFEARILVGNKCNNPGFNNPSLGSFYLKVMFYPSDFSCLSCPSCPTYEPGDPLLKVSKG